MPNAFGSSRRKGLIGFTSKFVSYRQGFEIEPEIWGSVLDWEWSNFFSGVVETTHPTERVAEELRRSGDWERGGPARKISRPAAPIARERFAPFRGDGRRTRIALTPTGKTR